jgi:hypothetical protein
MNINIYNNVLLFFHIIIKTIYLSTMIYFLYKKPFYLLKKSMMKLMINYLILYHINHHVLNRNYKLLYK